MVNLHDRWAVIDGEKLFTGETKNTPLYLYDADKFIRLKGLSKSFKSRKVRMLHHYYT